MLNRLSPERRDVAFRPVLGVRQTSQAAMAMRPYRVVHTGAKTQLGGLKLGLASAAYQLGMAGTVAKAPSAAIA